MMPPRTIAIADIHGEIQELNNLIARIAPQKHDLLIFLGDYVDRGFHSYNVIQTIIKLKEICRVITLRGNHDYEFFEGYRAYKDEVDTWKVDYWNPHPGKFFSLWNQGAKETFLSYAKAGVKIEEHLDFYNNCADYFVTNNKVFVHGGFNRHVPIHTQSSDVLLWDRDLLLAALSHNAGAIKKHKFKIKDGFDEVYLGHTPVNYWGYTTPQKFGPVWALDTGVGKYGTAVLYGVNVDTGKII
jgi:serine/threonine protein phosphatase 1